MQVYQGIASMHYLKRCAGASWCQHLKETFRCAKGNVAVGRRCNDNNACSTKDKCVAVNPNEPFDSGARCRGILSRNTPCNDFNDCTDGDVCSEIPYGSDYIDFPSFFACRGTLVEGRRCNDYQVCTEDDVCLKGIFGDATCIGTPFAGRTCDDYNRCTDADTCILSAGGDYAFCEGVPRDPC
jgi:hypothetical protein